MAKTNSTTVAMIPSRAFPSCLALPHQRVALLVPGTLKNPSTCQEHYNDKSTFMIVNEIEITHSKRTKFDSDEIKNLRDYELYLCLCY